jgi:ribosomal protein L14
MIQKNSYLMPADKCGVWWVKAFHLYGGFSRKFSFIGDFVRISVRVTRPDNWLVKKTKCTAVIVRTKQKTFKLDGSW